MVSLHRRKGVGGALWQLFHPGPPCFQGLGCVFPGRQCTLLTKVLQFEFSPIVENRVVFRAKQRRRQAFPLRVVFQEEARGHLIPPPKGP